MGLMHITGSRDGPPVKVGVAVTDLTTGLYASNSIMASLLTRARTGKGQHIDLALSDCQVATLANLASSCLISGERDTGRWGTAHRKRASFASLSVSDHLKHQLPNYVTNNLRVKNRGELERMIEDITQTKSTKEWLDVFNESSIPYAAVNDIQDTLNHEHGKFFI